MNNAVSQALFYDEPARSPTSQRQSTQPRQLAPGFESYNRGNMGSTAYFSDESAPSFDLGRGGLDRLNTSLAGGNVYNPYDPVAAQTWNPNAFSNNTFGASALNAASRTSRPANRGRGNLPTAWIEQQQQQQQQQQPPPPPPPPSQQMNVNSMGFGNMPPPGHHIRPDGYQVAEQDDELIPTAIVIKNIPFAVRKEELVDVMTSLNLPLPYAFNYHFDNGVFRGLAFANFTSAEETAMVIDMLNHYELHGRKLRVEYKKMLPLQERERIEREKRERRGQLEEQHRPMAAPTLNQPPSLSSLASSRMAATSPSPVESRNIKLDLNDPQVLGFYNEMLLFKNDRNRESVVFPTSLNPIQRRTIHTIAHMLGLAHLSRGEGQQRQVFVSKSALNMSDSNVSPPIGQANLLQPDGQRRTLNRAATTDFSEARIQPDAAMYGTLRGQHSAGGLLGLPDSPGGLGNSANLRAAKSFTDLRSYTPSPVPSTASYPNFQSSLPRMGDASGNTPTLTPTVSNNPLGQGPQPQRSGEDVLNGFGSMTIGANSLNPAGSPRRGTGMRNMFAWDREPNSAGPTNPSPAPIGSNRAFGMSSFVDDGQRNPGSQTLPIRQPRGPAPERAPGFARSRPNGQGIGHQPRGSDELSQRSLQQPPPQTNGQGANVEIRVEH